MRLLFIAVLIFCSSCSNSPNNSAIHSPSKSKLIEFTGTKEILNEPIKGAKVKQATFSTLQRGNFKTKTIDQLDFILDYSVSSGEENISIKTLEYASHAPILGNKNINDIKFYREAKESPISYMCGKKLKHCRETNIKTTGAYGESQLRNIATAVSFLKFNPAKIDKNHKFVINDFLDLVDFQHSHELNQCKFEASVTGIAILGNRELIAAEGKSADKNGISCSGLFFIDPKTGMSLLSKLSIDGLTGDVGGTKGNITWTMSVELP